MQPGSGLKMGINLRGQVKKVPENSIFCFEKGSQYGEPSRRSTRSTSLPGERGLGGGGGIGRLRDQLIRMHLRAIHFEANQST